MSKRNTNTEAMFHGIKLPCKNCVRIRRFQKEKTIDNKANKKRVWRARFVAIEQNKLYRIQNRLTASVANLHASLTNMHGDDFTHFQTTRLIDNDVSKRNCTRFTEFTRKTRLKIRSWEQELRRKHSRPEQVLKNGMSHGHVIQNFAWISRVLR